MPCYRCKSEMGSCVGKRVYCLPGTVCASITSTLKIFGNTVMNTNMKSCVQPQTCGNGSINFGVSRTAMSIQCCETHLCNSQDAPVYTPNRPNGRQCYTCDRYSCLNKLNCVGNEDHCITAKETNRGLPTTIKGCASKSLCSVVPQLGPRFKDSSCCQGNLCNAEKNLWDSEEYLGIKEVNWWDSEEKLDNKAENTA